MKYYIMALLIMLSSPVFSVTKFIKMPFKVDAPSTEKIYPIAVIGGGTAGIAAANRAVLNNDEIVIFTGK